MTKFILIIFCSAFILNCTNKRNSDSIKIFYTKDGKVSAIKYFKDSLLDAECFWYFPNGYLRQKTQYSNGKANGHTYYFYESGAMKSHRFYENNMIVGYMADYFDDTMGIIKNVLLYDKIGKLIYKKEFNRNGEVIRESGKKPE